MMNEHSFERRLPAATSSLAELRQTLREWLEGAVDDPALRADVVLAASELAVAAMRAAPGGNADLAVAAWVDNGSVVIETRSETGNDAFIGAPETAFDGSDGARGFSIIAALSDLFAVRGAPRGVVVRARLARHRFDAVPTG
jgi:anti-sigma regulatory factor (Ser/Thr protein kinase)